MQETLKCMKSMTESLKTRWLFSVWGAQREQTTELWQK